MADQAVLDVTFRLPADIVRHIDDAARMENKAPDQVVMEALRSGLPASREAVEARYQAALCKLQAMTDEQLQNVRHARITESEQARITCLLEANQERTLEPSELAELDALQKRSVDLAAENVIAWTVLRDRKQARKQPA